MVNSRDVLHDISSFALLDYDSNDVQKAILEADVETSAVLLCVCCFFCLRTNLSFARPTGRDAFSLS